MILPYSYERFHVSTRSSPPNPRQGCLVSLALPAPPARPAATRPAATRPAPARSGLLRHLRLTFSLSIEYLPGGTGFFPGGTAFFPCYTRFFPCYSGFFPRAETGFFPRAGTHLLR